MNKAFSLIELMVTLLILAIALPALLLAIVNLFALSSLDNDVIIATEDGRRVIEEMRFRADNSLANITGLNWTSWAGSNGLNSLTSEQIVVTYTDMDGSNNATDDDPLAVTVGVSWQTKGRSNTMNFSTLITER